MVGNNRRRIIASVYELTAMTPSTIGWANDIASANVSLTSQTIRSPGCRSPLTAGSAATISPSRSVIMTRCSLLPFLAANRRSLAIFMALAGSPTASEPIRRQISQRGNRKPRTIHCAGVNRVGSSWILGKFKQTPSAARRFRRFAPTIFGPDPPPSVDVAVAGKRKNGGGNVERRHGINDRSWRQAVSLARPADRQRRLPNSPTIGTRAAAHRAYTITCTHGANARETCREKELACGT